MSARENRLARETSPYLLQHAHNPVDWYPWGPEALARAKAEDKPILLSIGYAACHWCHVMERESFENAAVAALMNEHFVCVKVDREERPDLDEIYMQATVAMNGSGGWPMNVFLTPDDHEPFFAGTYFPPEDRYGRPGFPTLLRRIAHLWETERDGLKTQGREVAAELRAQSKPARPGTVGQDVIDRAVQALEAAFDEVWGGFGPAPKFPAAMALELLLRHHQRTGDARCLRMLRGTLDGMARGGIYDHVGGGFARYSTDAQWLVPHFEKMLYDNALLARVYVHALQVMGEPADERVVRETLDYVLREMTSEEGGFYSATDADSEGVEGKFFVWTPDEVNAILPPDQARAFCAHYDVTPEGNWEGHSILHTPRAMAEVATDLGISEETLAERLAAARRKIYAARLERVPPLLDDKILCAWNALMISALAEAGRILDEPRYREAAERAADFLWQRMRRPDGGLFRTTRAGKTHLDAYLEDYAYLCDALIDTYEATGEPRHLQRAKGLADRLIEDFHDEEAGGFFSTAKGHEALLVRTREGQDGALPSPNAVAAMALLRLSHHLDDAAWRALATGAIEAYGKLIDRAPRAFCASLAVIDGLLEGPVEAVLVGDAEGRAPFARALGKIYLPNRILVHLDPAVGSDAPEALVSGKTLVEGKAALYLCRNFACERPLTEPAAVRAMLELDRERAEAQRKRRLRERRAGRATQLGTARYVRRFVDRFPEGYGKLGKSELSVARLGFGGYRVDDGDPTFRKALVAALEGGANLIDTSSNYTGGGSERLVGSVLGELLDGGVIQRDEIVVVSKLGYAQGDNLALARARAAAGRPFPEMVEHDEACWHCIHPEWLDDQLERSLERLGLVTLDVCLLHNPEYFFAAAAREGAVDEAVRDRFYDRVERAFAWLEEQVAEGRIGAYGVSSNTVAQDPKEDPQATELPRFLQAARAAGGNGHHFRVLQLPLNLIESQAALPHEGDGATLLARAEDAGLAVLINRPLNAIGERGLERLVDPPEVEAASTSYAEALARLAALEASFQRDLAPSLDDATVPPNALFRLAPALENLGESLHGLAQWEQLARGEVIPLVSRSLKLVETAIGTEARNRWTEWRGAYIRQTELTLSALRASTARREAARATRISDAIDPHLPLARQGATLAQKALLTLVSTPGIHVTLLGMRRPSYVREALEVLRWPRFEGVSKVFEAAASCSKA